MKTERSLLTAPSAAPMFGAADYLTPAEAARLLRVSVNTVARWAREGKLPFARTLGGHRRFERNRVEALCRELEHGSPA
jgi:excisionase family DNA binding protein